MTVLKKRTQITWAWIYWTLQKDVELGIMRIYKNGELFMEGFNKTRPIGGTVESFRLGSGRLGGAWWNGWVDEFRIGLFIESPESIKASYLSQRPDAAVNFFTAASVEGPPVILANQKAKDMPMITIIHSHILFRSFHLPPLFQRLGFLQELL